MASPATEIRVDLEFPEIGASEQPEMLSLVSKKTGGLANKGCGQCGKMREFLPSVGCLVSGYSGWLSFSGGR